MNVIVDYSHISVLSEHVTFCDKVCSVKSCFYDYEMIMFSNIITLNPGGHNYVKVFNFYLFPYYHNTMLIKTSSYMFLTFEFFIKQKKVYMFFTSLTLRFFIFTSKHNVFKTILLFYIWFLNLTRNFTCFPQTSFTVILFSFAFNLNSLCFLKYFLEWHRYMNCRTHIVIQLTNIIVT